MSERDEKDLQEKEDLSEEEIAFEEAIDEDEETNKLVQLKETLELKDQELTETVSRLQRLQADFDNFRRRSKTEKEEFGKYANEKLVASLLPIIDNFERAIDSNEGEGNSFKTGVEMIFKQFMESLAKEGLKSIDAVGNEFDPNMHEAVMTVESDDHDANVVVEELQKGYLFKEKVIRPSMVKVANVE